MTQRQRSTLSRAHFTNWIIANLSAEGLPVGDNSTPLDPYGWKGAQPNATDATFTPWMSVSNGTARPSARPQSLGDAGSEHVMSYGIQYAAVTREQVEWLADKLRKTFVNAERNQVDCGVYGIWTIVQVQCVSIGGISRIRSALPDYYVQTDNFDIWASKEF